MLFEFKNRYKIYYSWLAVRPALVFLILSLVFGSLFIFRLAPLSGTDEFTHFPHVYQISEGTYWEQRLPQNQFGGSLPSNINNMVNAYRNLTRISAGPQYQQTETQLNSLYNTLTQPGKTKVTAIFTSTVIYPPWAYTASLLGVMLAKMLKLPLIWYVYLGRITALLVWIGLTYLAISIIPTGKWFLVALALLPTSLTQAATISSDGMLSGLSWLLIAMVLAILARTIKPSWLKLISISLLSIYIALIKDGYFLIGLLPIVIPSKLFINQVLAKVWKLLTLAAVIIVSILFTLRTVHAVKGVVLTPTIGMYMNSHQQIDYILHHLISFGLRVLIQPLTKTFDTTYLGIVGIMTNRLIYLSILLIFSLYVGLYLGLKHTKPIAYLVEERNKVLLVFLGIFILTYGLLATAFYIGNSAVGSTFVNGFYGRYFLPMMPLLMVIPMTLNHRAIARTNHYKAAIILISIIGLTTTIFSLQ